MPELLGVRQRLDDSMHVYDLWSAGTILDISQLCIWGYYWPSVKSAYRNIGRVVLVAKTMQCFDQHGGHIIYYLLQLPRWSWKMLELVLFVWSWPSEGQALQGCLIYYYITRSQNNRTNVLLTIPVLLQAISRKAGKLKKKNIESRELKCHAWKQMATNIMSNLSIIGNDSQMGNARFVWFRLYLQAVLLQVVLLFS